MKLPYYCFFLLLFLSGNLLAQKELLSFVRSLPPYFEKEVELDWLVAEVDSKAGLFNKDDREIVLANGLGASNHPPFSKRSYSGF